GIMVLMQNVASTVADAAYPRTSTHDIDTSGGVGRSRILNGAAHERALNAIAYTSPRPSNVADCQVLVRDFGQGISVTSRRRPRTVRPAYPSKRLAASRSCSYRLASGNGGNQDS